MNVALNSVVNKILESSDVRRVIQEAGNDEKKDYLVDVQFSYSGYLKVKASSEEEAKKIAQDTWIEEFNISEGSLEREVIDVRLDDE